MENASKALLIAAEVLIAIMLLTLFSYIFTKMSEDTARIEEKAKVSKITEFNQEFLNYEGRGVREVGKDSSGQPIYNPLTIQDIATLINLVKDNETKYKFYTKVKIVLDGVDITTIYNDGNALLKYKMDNNNTDSKYKCTKVEIDVKSKLVNKVTLEKF